MICGNLQSERCQFWHIIIIIITIIIIVCIMAVLWHLSSTVCSDCFRIIDDINVQLETKNRHHQHYHFYHTL